MLFPISKLFFLTLVAGIGSMILAFNGQNHNLKAFCSDKNLPSDSLFMPNESAGWGNYASYLHNDQDSVELELILYRNVPNSTDWTLPSETGTIDRSYAPQEVQVIKYKEVTRYWQITVRPDAKCFILLLSGPLPSGSKVVIPIKTKFKK